MSAEFSLDKYSQIIEPLSIEIHPSMEPVEIDFRPDAITRGDMKKISSVANDASDRDAETDAAMVKAISSWNIKQGGEVVPISTETFDKLGAVLYSKIALKIWENIRGKLKTESTSGAG